jgi:hypothetical protein
VDVQEPHDEQLERLLHASRPRPRLGFTEELESSLFPARVARHRRRRPLLAASGLAGGLALVALAFGLAGSGPLASQNDSSQAGQNCRYVMVKRTQRVPRVVTDQSGQPRIVTQKRVVERRVKRCS